MKVYVDTTFLISLYSPDANSISAARALQESEHIHLVSILAETEAVNGLQLRVFRKEISPDQADASLRDLGKDLSQGVFRLIRLPDESFSRAQQIARQKTARLGTRTADLLHVAAALELQADYLYSFDHKQRQLARALHLKLNRERKSTRVL